MNIADPVSSNLKLRKYLITKPGPKIHLQIEVNNSININNLKNYIL